MKGARHIWEFFLSQSQRHVKTGFARFYLMYFVAHEIMGHTAWRQDAVFGSKNDLMDDAEHEVCTPHNH